MRRPIISFSALAWLAMTTALPIPAAADPPPWAPAHGHRAKQFRYVYYPRYEAYYAPETRVWFWLDDGRWRVGASLPAGVTIGGAPGVSVTLDTERPYERHAYVVERYVRHHGRGGDDN